MPFFEEGENWKNYKPVVYSTRLLPPTEHGSFLDDYSHIYAGGLAEAEQNNQQYFDSVFLMIVCRRAAIIARACRAALFIMLYRGYPIAIAISVTE